MVRLTALRSALDRVCVQPVVPWECMGNGQPYLNKKDTQSASDRRFASGISTKLNRAVGSRAPMHGKEEKEKKRGRKDKVVKLTLYQ